MPNWSYIPYTSLAPCYAKDAHAAFHPMMAAAAYRRIRRTLYATFEGQPADKLHFLQCILHGVLTHRRARHAYYIVLESFGKPLFVVRNLAQTLEEVENRHVYMVHLEDALCVWRKREQGWWEWVALAGLVGVLGYVAMRYPVPTLRPHALMGFFSPPGY